MRGAGIGQEHTSKRGRKGSNNSPETAIRQGKPIHVLSCYEMEGRPVVTHVARLGVEKTETASLVRPNVKGPFHRNSDEKKVLIRETKEKRLCRIYRFV